jgi:hypothetical protein
MAAGDPGTKKRNYSATAIETTLVSSMTSAATGDTTTSVAVVSVSGFPSTVPFTLILGPDTNKEEVVTVTAIIGTTLTVVRGQDLTQAVAHSAGTSVRHGVSAREFKELQTHIAARGYDVDSALLNGVDSHVHGLASGDGSVVGTDKAQSLTNKSSITGLVSTGLTTTSATPKSYVDSILGSATSAATSASSAVVSANAAATSAASASTSAGNALTSANSASTSAASALTSQNAANTSAASASTSAASSLVSQNAASTSAASASASAASALTSQNAASTSAASALTSQTAAATSATSAATSATSAANSYTAIVDQTGKGLVRDMGSISDADTTTDTYISITTQVTQATQQATAAATSATSAATSATSAANSVNTIASYATAAATSATSAATSATAAATSATSAAASATAASTSAASAATSAASAATSASTAAAAAAGAVSGKLDLAGGTMTGALILNADPTTALGAVTKQYADAITAAINFHAPVARASTANIAGTYSNGTSGVGATLTVTATGRLALDGGNVNTNDRVLLKNQTTDLQNGIYIVTNQGGAGVSAILTRTTDYDNNVEVSNGDIVFCTAGTQNAGVTFVNTSTNPVTIGTSSITFSVYTSASLPSQTGNAGYFLTTDGTAPSWVSLSDWGTV